MSIDEFSMDFFSLKGKTAIVTGGNSGLGLAFSTALAKAGANLFIPSAVMDDGQARQLIEKQGVAVEVVKKDITAAGAPKQIMEACVKRFGTVDILVNNAGMILRKPAHEHPDEYWDKVIEVNLSAQFIITREIGRDMMERGSGKTKPAQRSPTINGNQERRRVRIARIRVVCRCPHGKIPWYRIMSDFNKCKLKGL